MGSVLFLIYSTQNTFTDNVLNNIDSKTTTEKTQ